MRKIILIAIICLSLTSCEKDSDIDCLSEKKELIETYDKRLELAGDDLDTQKALYRELSAKLSRLDC